MRSFTGDIDIDIANYADDTTPYNSSDSTEFYFVSSSIWLDVPHLTNENRTQDCIAR